MRNKEKNTCLLIFLLTELNLLLLYIYKKFTNISLPNHQWGAIISQPVFGRAIRGKATLVARMIYEQGRTLWAVF